MFLQENFVEALFALDSLGVRGRIRGQDDKKSTGAPAQVLIFSAYRPKT
jgi:hypothetical protein